MEVLLMHSIKLLERRCFCFNSAALLRLKGNTDKVYAELEEMKEEAAHTQTGVTISEFFKKRRYKQPIIIVLIINLGSQLSGFNAVSLKQLLKVVWLTPCLMNISLAALQILFNHLFRHSSQILRQCVKTTPVFLKT